LRRCIDRVLPHGYSAAKHQRTCQSNLSKLGLAMSQYIRDYDETFPLDTNWPELLWPYSKSKIFFDAHRALI
jgi:hypothetical protein